MIVLLQKHVAVSVLLCGSGSVFESVGSQYHVCTKKRVPAAAADAALLRWIAHYICKFTESYV